MKTALVALALLFLIVLGIGARAAWAVPAHYTDGTTFEGPTNYGPPPLAPRWAGTPCESNLIIDPPSFVWITEHAGTSYPTDGTEFASQVVNYHGVAPGTFQVPGAWLEGHRGQLALTWNIGTGESQPLTFDCIPAPSTTSTSSSTTTSTAPPAPSTTSTSPSTPSTPSTSIRISTPTAAQLPFTGSSTGPLLAIGAIVLSAGAALIGGSRHGR